MSMDRDSPNFSTDDHVAARRPRASSFSLLGCKTHPRSQIGIKGFIRLSCSRHRIPYAVQCPLATGLPSYRCSRGHSICDPLTDSRSRILLAKSTSDQQLLLGSCVPKTWSKTGYPLYLYCFSSAASKTPEFREEHCPRPYNMLSTPSNADQGSKYPDLTGSNKLP
ncbi:hypothetical protein K491DRAFT_402386 [Lophiostoma macrostomum CBS 122681]|uniref:Uncharacterized protein n=1 Tax=Lophiostoma macrostomum CBS 122681 TaxID=1314788 RepID=A0A6A6TA79_9PLEO|nr:hypothetical protein K491DRAFT_402386 [Lophiostoma macrostomum CBS 122681]